MPAVLSGTAHSQSAIRDYVCEVQQRYVKPYLAGWLKMCEGSWIMRYSSLQLKYLHVPCSEGGFVVIGSYDIEDMEKKKKKKKSRRT